MTSGAAVGALQRRRSVTAGGGSRLKRIGPDWPIWALTVGMPVLFLVGLQGLAWSLPFVVFGTALVSRPSVRVPRSALWLVLFCGWALLAAIQVHGSYFAVFGYRWTLFAGTLTCLVWVVNRDTDQLPTERLVGWLAALWIVVVVFGYLAMAAPHLDTASPIQRLLGPLGRAHFIADISNWRLAELQTSQGVTLPRPAAPFPASNGWGATIGLLTPFFVRSWIVEAGRRRRTLGILLLAVAMVPILVSGNRGLWIGISIAFVYWAVRRMLQGDVRPLGALAGLALLVVATMALTPAGKLVNERLNTAGRSNDARSSVYGLAWQGSLESPLVGHGVPTQVTDRTLPPIGSHGLLWYLMYCHGFVGLGLFSGWLVTEVLRSGRIRAPGGWWTHLSLLIALVQLPFYGMLPQVELIGLAAALAHRETGPGHSSAHPAVRGARRNHPTQRAAAALETRTPVA
ncbi:MAG: hypothetical protein JWN46_3697, partial [Acidimicrobiales bacterium]|nr:hypothetical protein [Acidimicrobiales bacterium]